MFFVLPSCVRKANVLASLQYYQYFGGPCEVIQGATKVQSGGDSVVTIIATL